MGLLFGNRKAIPQCQLLAHTECSAVIAVLLLTMLAFDDHGYGPVDPVPLPDISVTRHSRGEVRRAPMGAQNSVAVCAATSSLAVTIYN